MGTHRIIHSGLRNIVFASLLIFGIIFPLSNTVEASDTLTVGWANSQACIQVDSVNHTFYPLAAYVTVLPNTNSTFSFSDAKSPARQTQFIPYYLEIMRETPGGLKILASGHPLVHDRQVLHSPSY